MKFKIKFTKKRIIWGVIALIVIGFIARAVFSDGEQILPQFKVIERTDLVQKVSVTGKVKPIHSVDLTFEQNGKIDDVKVKVGDHVQAGDVLVTLSNQELWANLMQVEADLEKTQAQLREAEHGTRDEELAVKRYQVSASRTALSDAKKGLVDRIKNSYIQADYAIRNKIDPMFNNLRVRGVQPKLKFAGKYTTEVNEINKARFQIEQTLDSWDKSLQLFTTYSNLDEYEREAKINLQEVEQLLNSLSYVLNGTTPTSQLVQTQIDTYKTNVGTARTTISTAITSLATANEKFNTTESSLEVSQSELKLKEAGNTEEQMIVFEANVKSAEARLRGIQAQIDKTIIRAPINGIITKQESKKGEIISLMSMKEILISMIGEGYEIELNVPEVDISKIKIGDSVELEFDAFDDYMFESEVAFIEPAETEVMGVVYYQVKIALDPTEIGLEIRSGMSVDVDIITDKKENIISVPQRSVIKKDGKKIVRILQGENIKDIDVITGIRGSEGEIEILEGLKEGDKVVTSMKN